ncbi:hypothetical protein [Aestuariivirga sp.]|uniref:hypothetical protein n=1 Tax=Aestuariivirga sp. TaxID=2650926 RepID=UPI0030197ACE
MVVIDATILLLMLRPETPIPNKDSVDRPRERISFLVKQLDKSKTKIIVPTPALSEALVRVGASASQEIIAHLNRYSVFSIQDFDTRAAIEVAAMTREAQKTGNKRGSSNASWAKVKFDRQIVAIARVHKASTIYSDDQDIAGLCRGSAISVLSIGELPLPPEKAQRDMFEGLAHNPQESGDEEASR